MGSQVAKNKFEREYDLYKSLFKKYPTLFKDDFKLCVLKLKSMQYKRKPNPKELVAYKDLVRKLNSTFDRNHYFKTKMVPFRVVWMSHNDKWVLTCSDHYTHTDDKRLKPLLKAYARKYPNITIDLRFATDAEVREYTTLSLS